MKDMTNYYLMNQKKWDELAEVHYKKGGYDVKKFIKERAGLYPIEIQEVGSVEGKTLLHLQCHFGKDTLSWALRGAKQVTGVDFSDKAIKFARELAKTMEIEANFIHCNVYNLQEHLNDQFDIVFSSYGAIMWLHDLKKWTELIASYLKPGGFFYIVDAHPLASIFEEVKNKGLEIKHKYFESSEPIEFVEDSSYVEHEGKLTNTVEYCWNHSISEILNSFIDVGLTIELFNEHTRVSWKMFEFLEKNGVWWVFPEKWMDKQFPLLFSLKVRKS